MAWGKYEEALVLLFFFFSWDIDFQKLNYFSDSSIFSIPMMHHLIDCIISV